MTIVSLLMSDSRQQPLVRYEYDNEGRLSAAYDALGNADRYEYNADSRLARELVKDGGVFSLIAGKHTEFKSLDPGAGSGTVRNTVNQSIRGGGQARDIIIDARGSGLTQAEAERGLGRVAGIAHGKLDSVRIIGDGYDLSRMYE